MTTNLKSIFSGALILTSGALPIVAAALVGGASLLVPSKAQAVGGQCTWEGGPGVGGGAGYEYCEAQDCAGRGGLAQCSDGVGAVMNGYTDDQVEMNKWVYVADNGYNNQPINRGWCEAAGGEWYVPGANPYCINLPGGVPGVIGGGGRITNDEDLSLSIASGFVAEYLQPCGAQLVSDSGWTPTADRSFGVPITMNRERAYMAVGQNCSSGVTIYFSKIRAARCPPGYRSRTAVTGPECFIPAKCIPCAGKSVSVTTGAKYQREDDYVDAGQTGLHFTRYYNSTGYYWPEYLSSTYYSSSGDLHLTDSWRHTYGDRFMLIPDNTEVMAVIQRPDGTLQVFDTSGDEKTNGAGGGGAHVTLVPGIGCPPGRASPKKRRAARPSARRRVENPWWS